MHCAPEISRYPFWGEVKIAMATIFSKVLIVFGPGFWQNICSWRPFLIVLGRARDIKGDYIYGTRKMHEMHNSFEFNGEAPPDPRLTYTNAPTLKKILSA